MSPTSRSTKGSDIDEVFESALFGLTLPRDPSSEERSSSEGIVGNVVVVAVAVAVVGNLVEVGDVGGEISGGDGRWDTIVVESTLTTKSPKQFEHAAALQGGRGRREEEYRPMDLT